MIFADYGWGWVMFVLVVFGFFWAIGAAAKAMFNGAKVVMKNDTFKTAAKIGFWTWLGSWYDD
jgi:hypothetical protein